MQKIHNYSRAATVAGAIALIFPALVNAQTIIDTTTAVGVGASLDASSAVNSRKIGQTIKDKIQEAEDNGNYRNARMVVDDDSDDSRGGDIRKSASAVKSRQMASGIPLWLRASTTKPLPPFMKKIATSSELEGHRGWREARIDKFAALQLHLISQTQRSLDNLKQSRIRIVARIQTAESRGRDMTNAKALLVTADAKLLAAETAIQALIAYTPPVVATASSTASASSTVMLEKPRTIGAAAIQALKETKRALNAVVVAIAHSMGLKIGRDGRFETGTTTPPTSTTTPITATTTPDTSTTTPTTATTTP